MSSVFTVTRENAPTTFAVKQALPFQGAIFRYDINDKDGRSTVMHLTRSAITVGACLFFAVAALVEKAARFAFAKLKAGIDKVLTKDQQDKIKAKIADRATAAAQAGKGFFQTHFGALIS